MASGYIQKKAVHLQSQEALINSTNKFVLFFLRVLLVETLEVPPDSFQLLVCLIKPKR